MNTGESSNKEPDILIAVFFIGPSHSEREEPPRGTADE
jgi:hypothetical protein